MLGFVVRSKARDEVSSSEGAAASEVALATRRRAGLRSASLARSSRVVCGAARPTRGGPPASDRRAHRGRRPRGAGVRAGGRSPRAAAQAPPAGWIIVDPNGIAPSPAERGRSPRLLGRALRRGGPLQRVARRGVSSPSRRPSRRATSPCALPATTTRRRRGSSSRAGRRSATWTSRSRRSMGTKRSLRATRSRSSPRCARTTEPPIDRILLSDPRGAAVVLEGNELRAGDRVIDLTAPLEWRAFLFLESAGAARRRGAGDVGSAGRDRGRARRPAVRYARADASRRARPVDPRRPSSHRAPHGDRAPLHGAVPSRARPRPARLPLPHAGGQLPARRRARARRAEPPTVELRSQVTGAKRHAIASDPMSARPFYVTTPDLLRQRRPPPGERVHDDRRRRPPPLPPRPRARGADAHRAPTSTARRSSASAAEKNDDAPRRSSSR